MVDLKRYFFKLFTFSTIIFLLSVAFALSVNETMISNVFYFFTPYFLLAGMLFRYLLYVASKGSTQQFPVMYTAISMGRLLFSILLLVGYSLLFREDAYRFMIGFFVFYIFFTSYEIFLLFRSIHKVRK